MRLTNVGGKLFFAADDGFHGSELWVLQPPTATADAFSTDESGVLIVNDAHGTATPNANDNGLLSNDSDPTDSPLTVDTTPVSGPSHGTLTINSDGTFVYAPFVGFTGTDSFVYRVSNGSLSSTATATISVIEQAENSVKVVNCVCDPTGTQKALAVKGSSANDKIDVKLDTKKGRFDITIKPGSNSKLTFNLSSSAISQVIASGLDGNDDIRVDSDASVRALLFGGKGNDKLKSGKGDDVLVGGDGDDKLESEQGRDLLFGGIGADQLLRGDGEDLLVAGRTSHDQNLSGLSKIMDEWRSASDLATRVDHIMGGAGGLNGSFFLNAGDSTNPHAGEVPVTVFDDDAEDLLTGGEDADWFLANQLGPSAKDKVTDLKTKKGDLFSELG